MCERQTLRHRDSGPIHIVPRFPQSGEEAIWQGQILAPHDHATVSPDLLMHLVQEREPERHVVCERAIVILRHPFEFLFLWELILKLSLLRSSLPDIV